MGKIYTWYKSKREKNQYCPDSCITSLANDKVGVKPFGISYDADGKESGKGAEHSVAGLLLSAHRTQESAAQKVTGDLKLAEVRVISQKNCKLMCKEEVVVDEEN